MTNQGSAPDQLRLSVEGIPLVWVSTEKQVVLLQPGEKARVILNIQPSAPPSARTGRYILKLGAVSLIDPDRTAEIQLNLTVAGYEVKGRVGVLLDGVNYSVIPGEKLEVPVVLINQGLAVDTFRLAFEDLPQQWTLIPTPEFKLEPGEVVETRLLVLPPREPSAAASRYRFHLMVASQEAPDQCSASPAPTAVIWAEPQALAGQAVVFDGSASTSQVPLVSWKWDFGDGQTASGATIQHAFRDPGTYTVKLTVTDQRTQTGSSTQQIKILPPPTPTARPTSTPQPTAPPEQPTPTIEPTPELIPPQAVISGPGTSYLAEPVEFDASRSKPGNSPIVSYSWSFGNGASQPPSPNPSIKYIYERPGEYEVMVTVVDANGFSSTSTTRILVDARLDTDVWTLASINEKPLLPGTTVTMQFLEGELVGFAGCNTYTGEYTATDNGDGTFTVVIDRIKTSRLACPREIMDQEKIYLEGLQQATSAAIQENMLILTYPGGRMVFYFVPNQ